MQLRRDILSVNPPQPQKRSIKASLFIGLLPTGEVFLMDRSAARLFLITGHCFHRAIPSPLAERHVENAFRMGLLRKRLDRKRTISSNHAMSALCAKLPSLRPSNSDFLKSDRSLLINNRWMKAASGRTFETVDPATGEVLAEVPAGEKHDIDLAVKAARKAFENPAWSGMTPSQRGKLLWKLADLLEARTDEFAELESLDNGKPYFIAKHVDVPMAVEWFRYMAGWATKIEGSTIPISMPGAQFFSYTLREPVGVVGQIIPWNFPLLMASWKLAPALATGCTLVLKPAEQTPLTALKLGELILEAGYPEGVVNIVTGYGETAGAALAAHPDVDKVAFTGSTEVGRLIVRAAGESNLKKVSLELGGKSPNIIFPDANLDQAIPGAANAIFFNHGQCCTAGSRLYVHRKIFNEVTEGIAEQARKIKVGPGLEPETQMGPLVSKEQYDRVLGYVNSGLTDGAKALAGGRGAGGRGYFVEPTLLVGARPEMKIVQEEIFGPVVAAMPFDSIEEIPAEANNSTYGLAAAVWTKDVSLAHRMAKQLRAGSVWINCYNVFDPALPFGGYKQSGWGRENGKDVLNLYLETKAVTVQL
jgi:phenylacetaldehyde dehydrogenase